MTTDPYEVGPLIWAEDDDLCPGMSDEVAEVFDEINGPPKVETEEERNQRIWEAIQSVSQG